MHYETFEEQLKQMEEAAYKGCKKAFIEHNMIEMETPKCHTFDVYPEIQEERITEVQFDTLKCTSVHGDIKLNDNIELYFNTHIFAEQYTITSPDKLLHLLITKDCGEVASGYKYQCKVTQRGVGSGILNNFNTGACWINTVSVTKIHRHKGDWLNYEKKYDLGSNFVERQPIFGSEISVAKYLSDATEPVKALYNRDCGCNNKFHLSSTGDKVSDDHYMVVKNANELEKDWSMLDNAINKNMESMPKEDFELARLIYNEDKKSIENQYTREEVDIINKQTI